ncbi:immunoglobulin-like domain-containing protein [Cohnella hongkongensis]|uniref:Immunoglobulin-like domain-containing protein n=1 Tax=Cohnella hongkongensis TaxID=178337 RepID=A0ABV9FL59_9BACL
MRKSLIMALVALLVGLPLMGAGLEKARAGEVEEDGSPEKPYLVRTDEDLYRVREDLNASYRLAADIDLSAYSNWEPIGNSVSPFRGTFDGANYTISGMTIDSDDDYIGLFGQTAGDSVTIQNVRLVDVNITSQSTTVQVGGLVGVATRGRITNNSVTGEIKGQASSAGGLVGQLSTFATIEKSSSSVRLTFNSGWVGGLAGSLTSGASIEQSYATGDVFVSGSGYGGGLAGYLHGDRIVESYASGNVTATGTAASGGLVGEWYYGDITNSYASGSISSASGSAGGLVGENTMSPLFSVPIESSYWNSDSNPGLTTIGGEPGSAEAISEDELKNLVNYAGWETAYWGIRQGISYPYLKAFSPVVQVAPLLAAYSTNSGFNALKISGSIRDGSIGEPLAVGYVIRNAVNATVTSAVYATVATGEDQTFHFSATLNEDDYPEGTYTITVIGEDTVAANGQEQIFTFEVDSTAPVISLTGSDLMELQRGDAFTDPGATASDNLDGDVTGAIVSSGTVDTTQPGTYTLAYQVTDAVGNTATATRTVIVYNSFFPQLLLNGLHTMQVEVGGAFTDPGASASDERDDDITGQIEIIGSVDTGRVGSYSIEYRVTNSLGYRISTSRIVEVVDTAPPVLTLLGANPMRIQVGSTFTDPGATAYDVGDGDLTADITVSGSVYANQVGTYMLTYRVQDSSGNAATDAVRTVNVVRASSSSGGDPTGGGPSGGGPSGGGPSGGDPNEEPAGEDGAGNPIPPVPGCPFTDLEKHWAKSDICEAAELGIVEGVNAYVFKPNADVTRTEFAVMLLRALRIETDEEAGAVPFNDRDRIPRWADQAIRTAVAKGILEGYPDGTLRPLQTVNRSEMAAMVVKAVKWKAGNKGDVRFSDETSIPAWAEDYVEAARERGVLTGRDGNRFVPYGLTTRSEAAVVLLRLWKVLY